jgi:hypothetical protein
MDEGDNEWRIALGRGHDSNRSWRRVHCGSIKLATFCVNDIFVDLADLNLSNRCA